MAVLKVLQFDMATRIEELDEQLNACDLVRGRARTAIRDFLLQEGIYFIEDITDDDKLDFKQHLRMNISLSAKTSIFVGNGELTVFLLCSPA